MTPAARPDDPALLAAHVEGLRALARSLLGDAHLAEDVVQDAMVAVLRRPPAAGVPLGPWLVGVVRNLARFSRRGETRRTARERATVARAADEPADAVVARAEIHRGLVDSLLGLPEPYRATLLRRYFDGEEPTEIARRLGVPAETVRTRVHRGLGMLREALRAGRDDDAWRLALLPLVRGRDAAPTATGAGIATGVIVMTMKTKAVAALVLLALAAAAFYGLSGTPTPTPTDRDVAEPNSDAKPDARTSRRTRGANADSTLDDAAKRPDSATLVTEESAEDRAKWPIRVMTNVPQSKVSLQLRVYGAGPDPALETKTADSKGFVGFAAPATSLAVARFEFVARAEGWATTREQINQPGEVSIELRRAVAVRGVVRDVAGSPVADASIVSTTGTKWLTDETPVSVDDGTFEAFVEAPGPVSLRVEHRAFVPRRHAAAAPATDLVVVLDRGLEVSGRVAFPDGRPMPGVDVSVESAPMGARTDEAGRYVLSGLAHGPVVLRCEIASESRTVQAGATGVDFVVKRSVARIRYLDTGGRPFRFAGMSVRVVKDGSVLEMSAGEGPDDGVDFMKGPAGAQVLVSASGAERTTGSGSTTFDAEARLHDVDVVIGAARPTGTVRLIVRGESVETPKAVYVAVDDEMGSTVAGGGRERFELDAAGAGEIPNVPAGRVIVVVAAASRWSTESLDTLLVTARPAVDVDVGRTAEVVATLVVGGRVRASVRDEDGNPVTPHVVRLSTASDGRDLDMFVRRTAEGGWTTELDTSPSVLLDAVPAGRYAVQTKGPAGDEVKKEVEVLRGETTDVVLTVKAKR